MTAASSGAGALRGPVSFVGVCAAVLLASRFALMQPEDPRLLEFAVTLDLTLFIPLTFWWTIVRPRAWPAATVLPVFLLCVLGAGQVLPPDRRGTLEAVRGLAVLAEVALVAVVMRRVVSARRAAPNDDGGDPVARITAVTRGMLGPGRTAAVVAFEAGVLWFALLSWRRRSAEPRPGRFTHHRRASHGAVVSVLLLAIAVEMIPIHALLARVHEGVAWVATALSLYGALWLIGDWRALRLRSTNLTGSTLHVRFGLRWTIDVPRSAIIEAVRIGDAHDASADVVAALPAARRIRMALDRTVEARGPYGMRRAVRTIVLGVDDADRLLADLSGRGLSGSASS